MTKKCNDEMGQMWNAVRSVVLRRNSDLNLGTLTALSIGDNANPFFRKERGEILSRETEAVQGNKTDLERGLRSWRMRGADRSRHSLYERPPVVKDT
jgi:hypothetical protein